MDRKSVLGKLYKSVNHKLLRGLGWSSLWGITQFSLVTISFPLEVQSVVAWILSELDLSMRMAQPISFLDIVSVALRTDQNYHLAEFLVFSLFFI